MRVDSPTSLIRAAALAHYEELVHSLGGDSAALLADCGLSPSDLCDLDYQLPYLSVAQAIEGAPRALAAPDFGLRLCALQSVETLGLMSLAIQTAPTVRECMLQVDKYIHLHNPALTFRNFMAAEGGMECLEVVHRIRPLAEMPQITEICVFYMCRLIDVLSDGALRPAAIHLRHAPVGSSAQYLRHLGQLPRFQAAFDGIAVDAFAWRRPMPRHNRLLQQLIERFLLGQAAGANLSMADQVRAALGSLMRVGTTDLHSVARVLRQHPRTLQRHLAAEGVAFEALRDGLRQTWARELLSGSTLSIGEIANLLGFADQSVLTRACQRWFGATPRQLRRGLPF
ncbi:AraC family transcriptional regulator [Lampropedia aestuarii]|uniref:AraC family transcriptional regulator n=1 Tax=Lampropedia aestuarii TaxID=2562762 RepID=A0A4S5BP93_9BURK|nr:AraC family transcriptional regulator [Lampropedia aestuarii]THJ34507.1 AraC family transcriptional regulator [Lampropedia aestuarii]